MSISANVSALKEHLEQLFPGKWLSGQTRPQTLATGVSQIDQNLPKGLIRQRITEWRGASSSGKTSLLRACVANWCSEGHNVAYVDVQNKLLASDWAFVEQGYCAARAPHTTPKAVKSPVDPGRFWVIRLGDSIMQPLVQASWAADQLIRSNTFDVVVLDLGTNPVRQSTKQGDRVYGRLQRSLAHAKTALLVIQDTESVESGWGCDTRLSFNWGKSIRRDEGLGGPIMILPSISCSVWRDGLSRTEEVTLDAQTSNRLFTHPQIPDRRTPKK